MLYLLTLNTVTSFCNVKVHAIDWLCNHTHCVGVPYVYVGLSEAE